MEIENWMKQYCGAVRAAFGDRVRYIGLQGSRGRGEAGPDSDIDVVCILDSCSLQDLETYRAAVKDLPDRDKLCGFVSGTAELAAWDRGELFQFRRDTTDWCGRLADLLPPEEPGDARRALHQGACGLYHLCCHNFLPAEAGRRWRRPARPPCSCCRPSCMQSRGSTAAGDQTWNST